MTILRTCISKVRISTLYLHFLVMEMGCHGITTSSWEVILLVMDFNSVCFVCVHLNAFRNCYRTWVLTQLVFTHVQYIFEGCHFKSTSGRDRMCHVIWRGTRLRNPERSDRRWSVRLSAPTSNPGRLRHERKGNQTLNPHCLFLTNTTVTARGGWRWS